MDLVRPREIATLRRRTAHIVRLVLGVVMAVGSGVGIYLAEGWGLLTYLLPLVILLLTFADFIGYLCSADIDPTSADPASQAEPRGTADGGRDPGT